MHPFGYVDVESLSERERERERERDTHTLNKSTMKSNIFRNYFTPYGIYLVYLKGVHEFR